MLSCRCSLQVFYEVPFDESSATKWALIFVAIGVGMLAASVVSSFSFNYMGQKLARRVRVLMMTALLRQVRKGWRSNGGTLARTGALSGACTVLPYRAWQGTSFLSTGPLPPTRPSPHAQEVGWYDREGNSSGVLSSKLSADALAVKGQFGDTMGMLTQNLVTVIGGYVSSHSARSALAFLQGGAGGFYQPQGAALLGIARRWLCSRRLLACLTPSQLLTPPLRLPPFHCPGRRLWLSSTVGA
jgi:ABC-type multidrug transport system fused ATPase/permease subunit